MNQQLSEFFILFYYLIRRENVEYINIILIDKRKTKIMLTSC